MLSNPLASSPIFPSVSIATDCSGSSLNSKRSGTAVGAGGTLEWVVDGAGLGVCDDVELLTGLGKGKGSLM